MRISPVALPNLVQSNTGSNTGSGFENIPTLPRVVATAPGNDHSSDAIFGWFMGMIGVSIGALNPEDQEASIGSGENSADVLSPKEKEILKALIEAIELAGNGTNASGSIFDAVDYGNLSVDLAKTTIIVALRDINFYRTVGGHIPQSQGSLIDWTGAAIDWSLYDNGGTDQDVFLNFLHAQGGGS